jgi:uncharacterized protein (TIGR00251 family)
VSGAEVLPWRIEERGLLVRVRLTPKSQSDSVEGTTDTPDGPAVKARVRALPEDGAANRALETVIAKWLGVAKGQVNVVSGPKSRIKTVAVTGDALALAARATSLLSS